MPAEVHVLLVPAECVHRVLIDCKVIIPVGAISLFNQLIKFSGISSQKLSLTQVNVV